MQYLGRKYPYGAIEHNSQHPLTLTSLTATDPNTREGIGAGGRRVELLI